MSTQPSLECDSAYRDFEFTASSRIGSVDYVELRLSKSARDRLWKDYFLPDYGFLCRPITINLPGKMVLTDDEYGSRKRGRVSIKKVERMFFENDLFIKDTAGLVDAINYSLSLMRKDARYHSRRS